MSASLRAPLSRAERLGLAAAALAGIAMRIWVLGSPLGSINSDEAIVGLMARHIVSHGDVPVFFWGQPYGGSFEVILTAGAFSVFGSSVLALKAVPLALSAFTTLLIVLIGRRFVGPRPAWLAAAAFWVSTGNYVWWSTKASGFYWASLVFGLLFFLLAAHLAERPGGWRTWAALGLVGGLGWWTSPQILYFVVPGLAWLAWRARRALRRGLVAATPAAAVGAGPWLAYNVETGWASLRLPEEPGQSYLLHLGAFFTRGIPVALGLVVDDRWVVPVLFPIVYLAVVAAVGWGVWHRPGRVRPLVLLLLAYPFIFAAFPTPPYIAEGRYVLLLAPALWLLLAHWAAPARLAAIGLVPIVFLSIANLHAIRDTSVPVAPDVRMPNEDSELLRLLEARGVTRLVGNYWIAYRVAFETGERVIATPYNPAQVRFPPFDRIVRGTRLPAYAFVDGAWDELDFDRRSALAPGCYLRSRAGRFVVHLPNPELAVEPGRAEICGYLARSINAQE